MFAATGKGLVVEAGKLGGVGDLVAGQSGEHVRHFALFADARGLAVQGFAALLHFNGDAQALQIVEIVHRAPPGELLVLEVLVEGLDQRVGVHAVHHAGHLNRLAH